MRIIFTEANTTESVGVGSYRDFTEKIIKRRQTVARDGLMYNHT